MRSGAHFTHKVGTFADGGRREMSFQLRQISLAALLAVAALFVHSFAGATGEHVCVHGSRRDKVRMMLTLNVGRL